MEAGRELDALVAEKVMGLCIACTLLDEHDPEILVPEAWVGRDVGRTTATVAYHVPAPETDSVTLSLETGLPVDQGHYRCTLHGLPLLYRDQAETYSTDISPAWEVMEKARELVSLEVEFELCANEDGSWDACFGIEDFVCADAAPLVICLAALKAVGCSLEEEKS